MLSVLVMAVETLTRNLRPTPLLGSTLGVRKAKGTLVQADEDRAPTAVILALAVPESSAMLLFDALTRSIFTAPTAAPEVFLCQQFPRYTVLGLRLLEVPLLPVEGEVTPNTWAILESVEPSPLKRSDLPLLR